METVPPAFVSWIEWVETEAEALWEAVEMFVFTGTAGGYTGAWVRLSKLTQLYT